MSIAVLTGLEEKEDVHNYYHDLESLFYILVWICITYKGPNGAVRPSSDFKYDGSSVDLWCNILVTNEASLNSVGLQKYGMMGNQDAFRKQVYKVVHPYFSPLESLLFGLRRIIFRQNPEPMDESTPDN